MTSSRNYGFPYSTPYDSQLALMKDIYDTINHKNIGFFESPTGTGKTLTLLCGALSWLEDQFQKDTNKVSDSNCENIIDESNEPEWIRKFRQSNQNSAQTDAAILPSNVKRKLFKKAKIAAPPITTDDKISALLKLLDEDPSTTKNNSFLDLRSINYGLEGPPVKIYYCSRTHSQLSQVISELRKTSFFSISKPDSLLDLATVTSSRNSLCINEKIRNGKKNSSSLNEACQELLESESGCPYYNRAKDEAFRDHLFHIKSSKILDIEDLVKSGTDSQCCSYFSSRHLIHAANFIACPYNVILDQSTREAYGIDLTDNVVIFDEAHNIVDFIKQLNSMCIKSPISYFTEAIQCLEQYLDKFQSRLSGTNLSTLTQLKCLFEHINTFLETNSTMPSCTISLNSFIHSAKIDNFNFSNLSKQIDDTKLLMKVFGSIVEEASFNIQDIQKIMRVLENCDSNGIFIINNDELKFLCTNSVLILYDILCSCRSVIFCGGTMSPLQDTIHQLIHKSQQSRVVSKSMKHLVSPDNLLMTFLSKGPSMKTTFNFSFDSRMNEDMIRELGIVITNYSRIIPAGLIIFFTTFYYMEHVLDVWRSKTTNIFENICKIKRVFVEKRGVSSDSMLDEYEKTINTKTNDGKAGGGIIFAVMGGKLSEGINFGDDLGRGVILIGLPFLNVHDQEIKEQISSYVEQMQPLYPEKSKTQFQSEYLENACMRVVNQTIGRVIRHKDDYATIVLIDERAGKEAIFHKLSNWIQASFTDRSGKFDTSFRSTAQFFSKRKK